MAIDIIKLATDACKLKDLHKEETFIVHRDHKAMASCSANGFAPFASCCKNVIVVGKQTSFSKTLVSTAKTFGATIYKFEVDSLGKLYEI